jgi:hypothetical protein
MMDAAALLNRAADLIEPEGKWIQGALAGDRNGRPLRGAVTGADFCGFCWCIVGAIDKAWWNARCVDKLDVTHHRTHEAYDALHAHLEAMPEEWNDAPGRTQAEAVEALRAASAKGADMLRDDIQRMKDYRARQLKEEAL